MRWCDCSDAKIQIQRKDGNWQLLHEPQGWHLQHGHPYYTHIVEVNPEFDYECISTKYNLFDYMKCKLCSMNLPFILSGGIHEFIYRLVLHHSNHLYISEDTRWILLIFHLTDWNALEKIVSAHSGLYNSGMHFMLQRLHDCLDNFRGHWILTNALDVLIGKFSSTKLTKYKENRYKLGTELKKSLVSFFPDALINLILSYNKDL